MIRNYQKTKIKSIKYILNVIRKKKKNSTMFKNLFNCIDLAGKVSKTLNFHKLYYSVFNYKLILQT